MGTYVAALDFGSSKVALAVGEKTDAGVRIVACYDAPATGIECGEITNEFKVSETVRGLVARAEEELGVKVGEVTVGVSCRTIHARALSRTVRRRDAGSSIGMDEILRITRDVYREEADGGEAVFEAVPQHYSTEDRIGIGQEELVGMSGALIEADFKVFGGKWPVIDRRRAVLEKCGLKMRKAVLAATASARAVLSSREMENGAALVDIGKGLTQVAVVRDNVVRHVAVIPFGGESVTVDIKNETGVTRHWAETVKVLHGRCCEEYAVENRKLVLKDENGVNEGEVEIMLLTRIIEARMSEILDAVRYVIEQSGYAGMIPAGVVITGGCSHMDNILQLAEALLGRRVRLAAPQGAITGDSAEEAFDVYSSTAVGLVLETLDPRLSHALEQDAEPEAKPVEKPETAPPPAVDPPKKRGLFGGGRKGGRKTDDDGQLDLFHQIFAVSNDDKA